MKPLQKTIQLFSGKSLNTLGRTHFILFIFHFSFFSFAQVKDTTQVNSLDEVLVSAVRVTTKTPVSFSNLDKTEIKYRNLGQDIPILLNYLPSVVTTSDAGNGVGYTGIRVRGSDATRVNVTINGIPYNDSESHGTFWVNMPDFASSVESLQLQRGVGTSTNGAGAFGASLNLLTDSFSKKSSGELSNSFGSFNTQKHTVKFSTGLINDHFELAGRLSVLKSNGYIDRSSSDLKSYFLQGTYVGKTTLIKALAFGGKEKTYQSWYGIDAETLASNRTFNPAGQFTDQLGKIRFYDNQTDNYQQDHFQLHWAEKVSEKWNTNLAVHYTKGKGYYENYEPNSKLVDFGLVPQGNTPKADLISQKWLENDFYGTTFSVNYKNKKTALILGGGYNIYEGAHFGKVIWTRFASSSELGDRYYDNQATKKDANLFAKINYKISDRISLYGDLQLRNVHYNVDSPETGVVKDNFNFFNPKGGFNYKINSNNQLYFSYARANREPNRTDYENGSPKPESLNDFEFGLHHNSPKLKWNANLYYMNYKNQLILTGALDEVGNPIRKNSGNSYRLGFEFDATIAVGDVLLIRPNFTISDNRNKNFIFERDGVLTALGNTHIAYSPSFIAGNSLTFLPSSDFQISFLSKFVGKQYLGNIDSAASKLDSYFVTDFNISYEFKPKAVFQSILLSGLINNIFDLKYVSNGFFYTEDKSIVNTSQVKTIENTGYYPQAGINFLLGLTLKF